MRRPTGQVEFGLDRVELPGYFVEPFRDRVFVVPSVITGPVTWRRLPGSFG